MTSAEPTEHIAVADTESVDAIIATLYATISGPAGAPREWERNRALFAPAARLTAISRADSGELRVESFDAPGYRESREPYFRENAFYEEEVSRRTEAYGAMVHVFSTYVSRHEPGAPPFMRGINSMQLARWGGRWWVHSLMWQHESGSEPIPERYLTRARAG